MDLSLSEKQLGWQRIARDFAQGRVAPIAREMDESGEMPLALVGEMASQGLLGTTLPKLLGGSEMDYLSLALIYEELGRADQSVRGFMTVHSSLVMQCINQWGTDEQKQRYLPPMVRGEVIGCYALTEPDAGSDAASIQTTARKNSAGFILSGEKIWITNGNIARVAIVFAKQNGLPGKPHEQITAFLVPLESAEDTGIERRHMLGSELGHRASDHARISFKDCAIGSDAVLGGEGNGFKVAMSALDHGRLGVAAGALGLHQACLDASLAHVRSRKQFGQRLGDFEMVQSCVAEMKATLDASRLIVYRAAWLKDQGQPSKLETSIAKYYAVDVASKAASEAVLLHGNRGYSSAYPVERYFRDIKGLQIYEGTEHIQKIVIAREIIGKPSA